MKLLKILIPIQLLLSLLSGILIAQMSWLGKVGISISYKEYSVFKSWWQTAIIFFIIQIFLDILQSIVKKRLPIMRSNFVCCILLTIALIGLYATYHDFTTTFSHKLLKEKFHLGFYIFWITWMIGNLYFLFTPSEDKELK